MPHTSIDISYFSLRESTMMEIRLRTAKKEDLPVLLEFEQGIVEAERPMDPTLKDSHFHYYDIAHMIESEDHEVIVAVAGEEVIGSAYGSIRNASTYLKHDHYLYLGFMYVVPAYRGQGVNQKIIEALSSWATERDIYELRLDVYAENPSAIRAYEKAGFEGHLLGMRKGLSK